MPVWSLGHLAAATIVDTCGCEEQSGKRSYCIMSTAQADQWLTSVTGAGLGPQLVYCGQSWGTVPGGSREFYRHWILLAGGVRVRNDCSYQAERHACSGHAVMHPLASTTWFEGPDFSSFKNQEYITVSTLYIPIE